MNRTTLLLSSALALLPFAPAFAQDGDDVTIVLGEDIDLVEPCMATRSNIGRIIMQNVNETLTQYDVKDGQGVLPRLAESWEDQGNGTWRFNLRQGVTFSDGSTFDAGDVQHSFERAMSDQLTCETPRYFGDTKLSFNVVDDHTIDVTAEPAQPILPLLLSLVTIVPSETPVEFTREPVGTGPYTLASWEPGQSIVLERRDDYWGEAPAVAKATYVFRTDPAVAAAMVAQGEADLAPSIAAVDATNPDTDVSYLNSETLYLRLDSAIDPISDKRVREALNMAIDRDAFIGTLLPEGRGQRRRHGAADHARLEPGRRAVPLRPGEGDGAARGGQGRRRAGRHHALSDRPLEPVPGRRRGGRGDAADVAGRRLQRRGADGRGRAAGGALLQALQGRPAAADARRPARQQPRRPGVLDVLQVRERGPAVGHRRPEGRRDDRQGDRGDRRGAREAWQELFAYLHDEVVPDVLLFHMVSFARVGDRIDFTPTIATNSQLELADIAFK